MLDEIGNGNKCFDMFANHIRYHKGCLDGCMLKRIPPNMANDCINSNNENEYQHAFQIVMSEIQEKLLNEQAVYFVSQLRGKVRQYLIDNQVESVFMYTHTHTQTHTKKKN